MQIELNEHRSLQCGIEFFFHHQRWCGVKMPHGEAARNWPHLGYINTGQRLLVAMWSDCCPSAIISAAGFQ